MCVRVLRICNVINIYIHTHIYIDFNVLLPGIYSETEFMGTELCVKPYHKSGNNFYFWGVCGTGD